MIPRYRTNPAVIMEFKWKKSLTDKVLMELANEALKQITDKKFGAELKKEKVKSIIKLGIAFSAKKVRVVDEFRN